MFVKVNSGCSTAGQPLTVARVGARPRLALNSARIAHERRSPLHSCRAAAGGDEIGEDLSKPPSMDIDLSNRLKKARREIETLKAEKNLLEEKMAAERGLSKGLLSRLKEEEERNEELKTSLARSEEERSNAIVQAALRLYPGMRTVVQEEMDFEVERSLAELRKAEKELNDLQTQEAMNNIFNLRSGMESLERVRRSVEVEALASVTAARAAGALAERSSEEARAQARRVLESHTEAMKRVQDIIAKAAKAERAALVNKAECHALGKEVEHLRLKLEQAVERWKEANRRRNEAESAASERCKEAEHRADSRIKEAEDAFNQLRHQLYEKIHSLEREVDAKRREGGERAAERIRTLGELGEQAQYRAVEDVAKMELTEIHQRLASAEEAVAQAEARAEAAQDMVQERLKELEEESRRALEARTAELEAEFNERIAQAREEIVGEAKSVLSTVERALGKASELREKTDGDMKARAEAVVRDSETWKSKLAEAQHRLEQITQSREERTGGLESLQHLSPEELILAVRKLYKEEHEVH